MTTQTVELDRIRGQIKTLEGEITAERTRVEEASKRKKELEAELVDLGFHLEDVPSQIDVMVKDAATALEGVEKSLHHLQEEMEG